MNTQAQTTQAAATSTTQTAATKWYQTKTAKNTMILVTGVAIGSGVVFAAKHFGFIGASAPAAE